MNRSQGILTAIIVASLSLLGVGLYLQLVEKMLPCPLCVAQRYAFLAVALASLLALLLPERARRAMIALGIAAAAVGLHWALEHVRLLDEPSSSCGIDPLEVALNKFPLGDLFPTLLHANGICGTPYPPILGMSIPAWALIWFALFIAAFAVAFLHTPPRGMFGKYR